MTKTDKLAALQDELQVYKNALGKAADTIRETEVSAYPIFIAHQHTVDIGIPIIKRKEVSGNWSINASSLEEFVTKQIIQPDKVKEFQQLVQQHGSDICLFTLSELGANFIFLSKT